MPANQDGKVNRKQFLPLVQEIFDDSGDRYYTLYDAANAFDSSYDGVTAKDFLSTNKICEITALQEIMRLKPANGLPRYFENWPYSRQITPIM